MKKHLGISLLILLCVSATAQIRGPLVQDSVIVVVDKYNYRIDLPRPYNDKEYDTYYMDDVPTSVPFRVSESHYEDGTLAMRMVLKREKNIIMLWHFAENGQVVRQGTCLMTKDEAIEKTKNEDGSATIKKALKTLLHGKWEYWDKSGKKTKEEQWDNGNMKIRTEY
jgi:hypothetical protein